MISLGTLLKYYKQRDIQEAIVEAAKDKEIAFRFNKGFGKRPDILKYPQDVLELAKRGCTSFHCSEELWENPLHLKTGITKKEMDILRKGWDLILDIDCTWLEYSKIAAVLLVKALKYHDITSIGIKFSGNHGFHIAVPFESFPKKVNGQDTNLLFPDGPRKIAAYLTEMIKEELGKRILEFDKGIEGVIKKTGLEFEALIDNGKFDPYKLLEIDTILISSRHLYRMPYCFNEKSGLISIPIKFEDIMNFNKEDAHPEKIKYTGPFLERKKTIPDEAKNLIVQSFDFCVKEEKIELPKEVEYEDIKFAVPEELFPPCIKYILNGIEDGRKRAVFILLNFLSNVGWSNEQIDEKLTEWNKKNKPPLKEINIKGQFNYFKRRKDKILPPNCDNKQYYESISFCHPDNLCSKIKNPVNYAVRKTRYLDKNQDKEDKSKNKSNASQDNSSKNKSKNNKSKKGNNNQSKENKLENNSKKTNNSNNNPQKDSPLKLKKLSE